MFYISTDTHTHTSHTHTHMHYTAKWTLVFFKLLKFNAGQQKSIILISFSLKIFPTVTESLHLTCEQLSLHIVTLVRVVSVWRFFLFFFQCVLHNLILLQSTVSKLYIYIWHHHHHAYNFTSNFWQSCLILTAVSSSSVILWSSSVLLHLETDNLKTYTHHRAGPKTECLEKVQYFH